MVVDEHDARVTTASSGACSATSVPSPGAVVTRRRPAVRAPCGPRSTRRCPRRSAGTALAVEAGAAVADEDVDRRRPSASAYTETSSAPEKLRRVHHRLARGEHDGARVVVERRVARARRPRRVTPCSSSTSAAASADRRDERVRPGRAAARGRASRAARAPGGGRAAATRCGSSASRWISASVCSTESCTRAATSARSSRADARASARRRARAPVATPTARRRAAGRRRTLPA